jgi:hypothetical protein
MIYKLKIYRVKIEQKVLWVLIFTVFFYAATWFGIKRYSECKKLDRRHVTLIYYLNLILYNFRND